MALKAEDDEDPFWVAAFEGRELDARDELMPDREHEEVAFFLHHFSSSYVNTSTSIIILISFLLASSATLYLLIWSLIY
jgi:hypothetical protein